MTKSFTQNTEELTEFLNLIEKDKENIKRVKNTLDKHKVEFEIHPKAKSVDQSAKHSNIPKKNIIKTLVFKTPTKFIAVMCPGHKRVSEEKLEEKVGEPRMATPSEVENKTGYVVGGVSPFDLDIPVYAAKSIPNGEVRPAAGSRVIGVKIELDELLEITEAETLEITD